MFVYSAFLFAPHPPLSCRPGVPAGSQLCRENAGADPGPTVQGVWGPGRSCTRGTAEIRSPAGETDGAPDPPSQLPPADEAAAWALTERSTALSSPGSQVV